MATANNETAVAPPLDVTATLLAAQKQYPTTEVPDRPIPLVVDLGHLCVLDQNIVMDAKPLQSSAAALESFLQENTRDAVQTLVNKLWQQPTRNSEDGTTILADLPAPIMALPREKGVPKPKATTRWEKFAKEKGIKNTKKSKLVWDEASGDWTQRWGYKSGVTAQQDWCLEVPDNADPYEDQFAKKKAEKTERISKNKKLQRRNEETAAAAAEGSTVADVRERRKGQLAKAVAVSRKSTASLGRFDKQLRNDSAVKEKGKRRKFDDNVADLQNERTMSAKVLAKVGAEIDGGAAAVVQPSSKAVDRFVPAAAAASKKQSHSRAKASGKKARKH